MKEPRFSTLPDSDMQAVPAALRRASERAREIARRSGTPLIVVRAGLLLELDPDSFEIVGEQPPGAITINDR